MRLFRLPQNGAPILLTLLLILFSNNESKTNYLVEAKFYASPDSSVFDVDHRNIQLILSLLITSITSNLPWPSLSYPITPYLTLPYPSLLYLTLGTLPCLLYPTYPTLPHLRLA